ncbi:hypothetical protein D3C71_923110 [compost metagenome]
MLAEVATVQPDLGHAALGIGGGHGEQHADGDQGNGPTEGAQQRAGREDGRRSTQDRRRARHRCGSEGECRGRVQYSGRVVTLGAAALCRVGLDHGIEHRCSRRDHAAAQGPFRARERQRGPCLLARYLGYQFHALPERLDGRARGSRDGRGHRHLGIGQPLAERLAVVVQRLAQHPPLEKCRACRPADFGAAGQQGAAAGEHAADHFVDLVAAEAEPLRQLRQQLLGTHAQRHRAEPELADFCGGHPGGRFCLLGDRLEAGFFTQPVLEFLALERGDPGQLLAFDHQAEGDGHDGVARQRVADAKHPHAADQDRAHRLLALAIQCLRDRLRLVEGLRRQQVDVFLHGDVGGEDQDVDLVVELEGRRLRTHDALMSRLLELVAEPVHRRGDRQLGQARRLLDRREQEPLELVGADQPLDGVVDLVALLDVAAVG